MLTLEQRETLHAFSSILTYPQDGFEGLRPAIESLKKMADPKTAEYIAQFENLVSNLDPGRLEEYYTEIFDLHPNTHLYVGGHLFGETYLRSGFIIRLKEEFENEGFAPPEKELPDHMSVLLEFLSKAKTPEVIADMVSSFLIPAFRKMLNPSEFANTEPTEEQVQWIGETRLKEITTPEIDSLITVSDNNPYFLILTACLHELEVLERKMETPMEV